MNLVGQLHTTGDDPQDQMYSEATWSKLGLYMYQVTKGFTQPKDMNNAAQNPYSLMY